MCTELTSRIVVSDIGASYGLSIMLDEQPLIYWAAIEVNDTNDVPSGMALTNIPAGKYVCCKAASLEQLNDAYQAIFIHWPKTQKKYQINMQGVSFESYANNWQPTDEVMVYASVVEC